MHSMEKSYNIDKTQFFYDYSDGLAIIINSTTGVYYGINILGSSVFNQLIQGASPASLLEQLENMQGCPLDITDKLNAFMERLESFGLLTAQEQIGSPAHPFEENLLGEEFCFEVEEFAEIQEILLADPIHDVNSDYGWPVLAK